MPEATISLNDSVDLQTHTTWSDGQWTPRALFDALAGAGIRVVAVTDHDTLDGLPEMRTLGRTRGVHVVPAVEVTTNWRGRTAHLLCFAREFRGNALGDLVRATHERQLDNTREVHDVLLRRGHTFPRLPQVLRERGGELARPVDNATLLVEHGYAPNLAAALDMIRAAGFHSVTADLSEAVGAAHASGALAVIAHPGRHDGEIVRYEPDVLDDVHREAPFDGIEVYYPIHSPDQTAAYARYAETRGLLVSAGSDSHGPRQRPPIAYPARLVRPLLERCGIQVTERI